MLSLENIVNIKEIIKKFLIFLNSPIDNQETLLQYFCATALF